MAAAAILDFQAMWISPFRCVDSVVFELCIKFDSNICYSHWDRRTYASDVTQIDFRFRLLVTWSSLHGCDGSSYKILCRYFLSSPELLTFFRNPRWRQTPCWIFSLYDFGHSGVLMVWYLCSVPNLVQISVTVTEIDAHNALDVHLMTSRELTSGFGFWSCGHLRMAAMHLPI